MGTGRKRRSDYDVSREPVTHRFGRVLGRPRVWEGTRWGILLWASLGRPSRRERVPKRGVCAARGGVLSLSKPSFFGFRPASPREVLGDVLAAMVEPAADAPAEGESSRREDSTTEPEWLDMDTCRNSCQVDEASWSSKQPTRPKPPPPPAPPPRELPPPIELQAGGCAVKQPQKSPPPPPIMLPMGASAMGSGIIELAPIESTDSDQAESTAQQPVRWGRKAVETAREASARKDAATLKPIWGSKPVEKQPEACNGKAMDGASKSTKAGNGNAMDEASEQKMKFSLKGALKGRPFKLRKAGGYHGHTAKALVVSDDNTMFDLSRYFTYQGKKDKKAKEVTSFVVLGVRMYKVSDINFEQSTFTMQVRLFYEWELPPGSEVLKDGKDVPRDLSDDEIPEIEFTNATKVEKHPWTRTARVLNAERRIVYTHRMYDLVLHEVFDLHAFPFDIQRLHLTMQLSKKKFNHCGLRLLPFELRGVNQLVEWDLLPPRVNDRHAGFPNGKVAVQVVLRRRPGYYIRNLFGMILMLTTCGFISFCIPRDEMTTRIEVVVAVMFTVIAFMFTTVGFTPKVGYSTTLDQHQRICAFTLFFIALLHGVHLFIYTRAREEEAAAEAAAAAAAAAEGASSSADGAVRNTGYVTRSYLGLGDSSDEQFLFVDGILFAVSFSLWCTINGTFFVYWLFVSPHSRKWAARIQPNTEHQLYHWTENWTEAARELAKHRGLTKLDMQIGRASQGVQPKTMQHEDVFDRSPIIEEAFYGANGSVGKRVRRCARVAHGFIPELEGLKAIKEATVVPPTPAPRKQGVRARFGSVTAGAVNAAKGVRRLTLVRGSAGGDD